MHTANDRGKRNSCAVSWAMIVRLAGDGIRIISL